LAAAGVKDLVLFGGGLELSSTGDPSDSDRVDIFNAISDEWTTASLSVGRFELTAASVNDLVLFGGGYGGSSYSDRVDIFHATSGAWTTARLSVARADLASATVGDIVLFGGGQNTNIADRVDIYNANSGVWTTASLSVARDGLAAASVKDLVLFGGGYNGTESDRVDIFHATSGAWTTARLSVARAGLAAATVRDIVLFGGGEMIGMSASNRVDIYNATSGIWITASLSVARRSLAVASVNDLVLFGGGYKIFTPDPDTESDRVDFFNATSGVWTTASLSVARGGLAAATVRDIVLFGGGDETYSGNRVDIFNPCASNTDCDDGIFCNGVEICQNGLCLSTSNPCLNGATCNNTCNENAKNCLASCESSCKPSKVGIIAGAILGGVALLVLIGAILYYLRRQRSSHENTYTYTKLDSFAS
jgi:hypothetical protein